jgi:hypothetical protein
MAVASTLINQPQEAVDMLYEVIRENAGMLGMEYVGQYDENLLPRYPNVVISPGVKTKEVHATHTFAITLRCILWVYHAKLTETHTERNKEDLEFATAIETLIEEDKTFDGRVIFSFVESSTPGILAARTGKGEAIVGTRLAWECVTQQRWE